MNKRERSIVYGSILGDAFIQPTGKKNARIRLEHGARQKEYILWKWQELKRYMQRQPTYLDRFNPIWRKRYAYYRCQSHASPEFGKLRLLFYQDNKKIIPDAIGKILSDPLTLAVWFMDDGYYYGRDKTAYIYLSKLSPRDVSKLQTALEKNFKLPTSADRRV